MATQLTDDFDEAAYDKKHGFDTTSSDEDFEAAYDKKHGFIEEKPQPEELPASEPGIGSKLLSGAADVVQEAPSKVWQTAKNVMALGQGDIGTPSPDEVQDMIGKGLITKDYVDKNWSNLTNKEQPAIPLVKPFEEAYPTKPNESNLTAVPKEFAKGAMKIGEGLETPSGGVGLAAAAALPGAALGYIPDIATGTWSNAIGAIRSAVAGKYPQAAGQAGQAAALGVGLKGLGKLAEEPAPLPAGEIEPTPETLTHAEEVRPPPVPQEPVGATLKQGEPNATNEGQQPQNNQPEHQGISQGTNIPENGGEVREGAGAETGNRGGTSPSSQSQTSEQDLIREASNHDNIEDFIAAAQNKYKSVGSRGQDIASDDVPVQPKIGESLKIKNEAGEKISITPKEGEKFAITPFKTADGKIKYELHDGDAYVVPKNTAQDLINRFGFKGQDFSLPKDLEVVRKGNKLPKDLVINRGQNGYYVERVGQEGQGSFGYGQTSEGALADYHAQRGEPTVKYKQYTLPEGKNYREVLLKAPQTKIDVTELPKNMTVVPILETDRQFYNNGEKFKVVRDGGYRDVGSGVTEQEAVQKALSNMSANKTEQQPTFKSSHWDEPNVVAHTRLAEHTADGKQTTLLEEIQSDWAREGRDKGFLTDQPQYTELPEGYKLKTLNFTDGTKYWVEEPDGSQFTARGYNKESAINEAINRLNTEARGTSASPVPNHPALKNWQTHTLKQSIKEAVDSGSDSLSWVTGEQTADRYDLSKQVDKVFWGKNNDGTFDIRALPKDSASEVSIGKNIQPDKIQEYVGKDTASKILDKSKNKEVFNGTLSGVDLKVGGEWSKNLYDRQIPNILKDLTKRYNTKFQDITLENGKTVHSMTITPELREAVGGDKGTVGAMSRGAKADIYNIGGKHYTRQELEDIFKQGQKVKENTSAAKTEEVAPKGEMFTPLTSEKLLAWSKEHGYNPEEVEKLPQNEKRTFIDQAQKADTLVSDTARAGRILRGEEPLPDEVSTGAFLASVQKAIKDHPELLPDLANNKVAMNISKGAQETSLARMIDPDSATKHLQDVKKIYESKANDVVKKTEFSKAKKAITDINLTKEDLDLNNFIDSIVC